MSHKTDDEIKMRYGISPVDRQLLTSPHMAACGGRRDGKRGMLCANINTLGV